MNAHKLLLVDDEENILKALQRLLQNEGYEIFTAPNGFEGIKLLDKHDFAVILSDYRMPELNGVEFLKLAKDKTPDTIRIILTGYADMEVVISAINEGEVYKFIEKPWESDNLRVQVQRAVEHYDLTRERDGLLEKIKAQNEELKKLNETLEQKVVEKTHKLKEAYEKLQIKVKELLGRDTILQSLLTIHTLEETLELILGVILDITSFDKIVLFVSDKDKNQLVPKAGFVVRNNERSALGNKLNTLPPLPVPEICSTDDSLLKGVSSHNRINDHSFYIPVAKDRVCTGMFLVENDATRRPIEQNELEILAGFSHLTALAVNEYFVTTALPDLHDKVTDFLKDIS